MSDIHKADPPLKVPSSMTVAGLRCHKRSCVKIISSAVFTTGKPRWVVAESMAEQASQSKRFFEFLIVGKTGVGKSALINSVAGSIISGESSEECDQVTSDIQKFDVKRPDSSTVRFWDTPEITEVARIRERCEKCHDGHQSY